MRVRLKGINPVKRRLASGEVVTYYYLGKGGPRIRGLLGTPEFMASYNEQAAAMHKPPQGVILSILQGYQASDDFLKLANRTRSDYKKQIKIIEAAFGDFPLSALLGREARGVFLQWRDKLALRSRRQADYAWTVLARVFSWAFHRGLITKNPCERGGRTYRGTRVQNVWLADDVARFMDSAPHHLRAALPVAVWTGQRQGDLLRLTWNAYDGSHIRLKQSKGGKHVKIPVGEPLKAMLNSEKRRALTILTTEDGEPWQASKDGTFNGFQSSWRKAQVAAGITGLTFGDLRGTAATYLAQAGCDNIEIKSITGHSLRDVGAILETHYLDIAQTGRAESAILKAETGTSFPKWIPK